MNEAQDWRAVYDFWFPPGLDDADPETHGRMFVRWFGGGANAELPPFAPVLDAARTGRLDHWLATPLGRLSLIVVLDQFPRGLFAGTPEAYAADPDALRVTEQGLRNGHYDALTRPWEKTFFFLPLGHAEGPDHVERLRRVVAMAERIAHEAPRRLQPLYRHSVGQARGHLDVISRFGRFPHRNPVLGRASTPEEVEYLDKGDFVHMRRPPPLGRLAEGKAEASRGEARPQDGEIVGGWGARPQPAPGLVGPSDVAQRPCQSRDMLCSCMALLGGRTATLVGRSGNRSA